MHIHFSVCSMSGIGDEICGFLVLAGLAIVGMALFKAAMGPDPEHAHASSSQHTDFSRASGNSNLADCIRCICSTGTRFPTATAKFEVSIN